MRKHIEIDFTTSNAEVVKESLRTNKNTFKSFLKLDDVYGYDLPIFEFTTKKDIEFGRYDFKFDDELSFSDTRIEYSTDKDGVRNYYCRDYKVFLETKKYNKIWQPNTNIE
jgi:hypothetical protein